MEIRPALWSTSSLPLLDELRRFRHLFRHAYGFEIDAARVALLIARLASDWDAVGNDMRGFRAFVAELARGPDR